MTAQRYSSPDENQLTTCIKDTILVSGPAGTLGSVAALPGPFTHCPINNAVIVLARLGDVKVKLRG